MTTGKRIKQRRLALGMSVDELASNIGKDRSTVYRYESGDIGKMPIEALCPLARALQVTPQSLLGWDDLDSAIHIDAETREAYKASLFTNDSRMAKNHIRWSEMSDGHKWSQKELDILFECGKCMITAKEKEDYAEFLTMLEIMLKRLQ